MPKDRIGNAIEPGALVSAMCASQRDQGKMIELFGHVVEVHEGGIAVLTGRKQGGQGEAVTPGRIKIRFEMDYDFDPRSGGCPAILVLPDPNAKPKILQ